MASDIGDISILKPRVRVLIQDRFSLVRTCLRMVLEENPTAEVVGEAATLPEAIRLLRKVTPDIVFLDLDGEGSVGATIEAMKEELPEIRIICMAESPPQHLLDDVLAAGAHGLTLKSDSTTELRAALAGVTSGRKVVTQEAASPLLDHYVDVLQEKRLKDAKVIEALASAVEAKDRYTGGHAQRVATLALQIAGAVDPALESSEELRYGFVLHDIGKIGVPEEILLKEGPLTDQEWEVMRTHPEIGVNIISPIGFGRFVEGVVRHHHERWDGKGYPHGLATEEIPIGARIFSVADAYDAMTTDRPYRRRVSRGSALSELRSKAGSQFDPESVAAMEHVLETDQKKAS